MRIALTSASSQAFRPGRNGEASSHPAPGPQHLFDHAVDDRGALTLQVLRNTIGDHAFLTLLKAWPTPHRYGNATTADLQHLAEHLSGKDLTTFFQTWLYTPTKPATLPAGD